MRFSFRCILTVFLLLMVIPAAATTSASELVRACEHALENGFYDIKGMLCTWYVTPCDCEQAVKPGVPRVCLPPDIAVESLAVEVIDGIKAQEALMIMDADIAAATVLSRHYPCPE